MKKAFSAILVFAMLLTLTFSGGTVFAATTDGAVSTATTPEKAGYVFGGWYSDATFETAYSASDLPATAYAKFVDAKALSVKYQITADTNENSTETNLRVVTTVDSLDYQSVGLKVEYPNNEYTNEFETTKVSTVLKGFAGADEFNYTPAAAFGTDDAVYFCAWNFTLSAARFDTGITFTPFWITKDGTKIYGSSADPDHLAPRVIIVSESANYNEILIGTAAELTAIAEQSSTNNFEGWKIRLTADIDLNPGFTASTSGFTDGNGGTPTQWTSIGYTGASPNFFKGTFDGHGHTISGLYQNSTTHTGNLNLGLFAATSGVSTVKNFRLVNSYIYTKGARNGSIAGDGCGNFENIYSDAIIVTE
ncbi:MAG: InlB B-repeat-containing protein, partial [Clostridia bacterium]|nr:InlB B-repeat-containing protein [Clostridia bacterium]